MPLNVIVGCGRHLVLKCHLQFASYAAWPKGWPAVRGVFGLTLAPYVPSHTTGPPAQELGVPAAQGAALPANTGAPAAHG